MFGPKIMIAILVGAVAVTSRVQAFEQSDASYSATRLIESKEGSVVMRVFHRPNMERVELDADGRIMTTLVRWDRNQAIQLIPEINMYMEIPLDRSQVYGPEDVKMVEREELGVETVNGHQATKYKAIYESPDGGRGDGLFWFTTQEIPIKMDAVVEHNGRSDRVKMELRDLEIADQPDHLFEVPTGYSKMVIPGGGNPNTTSRPMERTDGKVGDSLRGLLK